MKKIEKIYVVACQHGDETFGLKILARLAESNNPRIRLRIGNLEALSRRKRHIESDLNRSYYEDCGTKEGRIARSILTEIAEFRPDVILDLHTSTVDVGKVAITAEDSPLLQKVAAQLSMERIAVMLPEIAGQSLIGQLPDRSLALEFGVHKRSDKLADGIAARIEGLVGLPIDVSSTLAMELYRVERIVPKTEILNLAFRNFDFNDKLGGYPVLMGEKNYSDYAGFLATKVR